MDNAYEIWIAAAQLYFQQGNDAQAYELRKKIHGFFQKDISLAEYFAKLSSLWQELDYYQNFQACCSQNAMNFQEMIAKKRVYDFLAGLNMEYDQIRVQVLGRHSFSSVREAYACVLQEESRRSAMIYSSPQDRSVLVATPTPRDGKLSQPKPGGKGGLVDRDRLK